ncbi:hypothetical protein [Flavobacterium sp. 140616W15]|uniref:hypothetical protein n=1 Tax=Flavobacterium sp. 140616W15 TaxID=2478552 RepID=UPI000F0C56F5|nr:hypothetical protein [Flavobacterium sp. 140616W15]AYN03853.1 hypothetical protein EAG11_06385 [Flavobacterium sp. 140616W15]
MKPIKIGDWLVTEKGIEFTKSNIFLYEQNRLIETEEQQREFTNSLLNFVKETNLSPDEFTDLGRALIYAEACKLKIDRDHILNTIKSLRS